MKCTNPACGAEQFPRLDPAVIVLVSDGERALLGRQASWPAGRYSTIAGFVEPGESLEDAVAREVLEETGVARARGELSLVAAMAVSVVADDRLHGTRRRARRSARTTSSRTRAGSRATNRGRRAALPPSQSVSFRLIEEWFDAGGACRCAPRLACVRGTRCALSARAHDLTPELVFVVAAAFAAGLVDAMAGGGGLIEMPALFAALPQTPPADLLGTGKVASLSGSLSAARYARHVRFDGHCCACGSRRVHRGARGRLARDSGLAAAFPGARARHARRGARVHVAAARLRPRARAARAKAPYRLGRGAGIIGGYDGFFGPGPAPS